MPDFIHGTSEPSQLLVIVVIVVVPPRVFPVVGACGLQDDGTTLFCVEKPHVRIHLALFHGALDGLRLLCHAGMPTPFMRSLRHVPADLHMPARLLIPLRRFIHGCAWFVPLSWMRVQRLRQPRSIVPLIPSRRHRRLLARRWMTMTGRRTGSPTTGRTKSLTSNVARKQLANAENRPRPHHLDSGSRLHHTICTSARHEV